MSIEDGCLVHLPGEVIRLVGRNGETLAEIVSTGRPCADFGELLGYGCCDCGRCSW